MYFILLTLSASFLFLVAVSYQTCYELLVYSSYSKIRALTHTRTHAKTKILTHETSGLHIAWNAAVKILYRLNMLVRSNECELFDDPAGRILRDRENRICESRIFRPVSSCFEFPFVGSINYCRIF